MPCYSDTMEMNRRCLLTTFAALGLTSPAYAAAGFAVKRTNEGLVLPVGIGGQKLRGVLDCGASASIIDRDVAQGLGLRAMRERKGIATYAAIRAGQSQPVEIAAGDAVYTAPLMIMPLKPAGLTSDIIIGRDVLESHTLDLDGPNLRASFLTQRPPVSGMRALPVFRSPKNSIVVEMQIEDVPVRASVDTGSQAPLMLKSAWARANGFLDGRPQWQQLGGDVTGLREITMSSVAHAALAGLTFRDVPAEVSDNRLEYDVNLGLDVFLRLRSWWDLADGRIWLSGHPQDVAQPFGR